MPQDYGGLCWKLDIMAIFLIFFPALIAPEKPMAECHLQLQ
jgi:hypothetical protein